MTFQLHTLPYDYSALEPHLSARTLEFHHDKHHATYVNTLNKLTQDTPLGDQLFTKTTVKPASLIMLPKLGITPSTGTA